MSAIGHPRFSDQEITRRYDAARALMEEQDLEALFVFGHSGNRRHYQADILYFTETAPFHECYCLVPRRGEPVLWSTHNNHFANTRELSRIPDVRRAGRDAPKDMIPEFKARGLEKARIGVVGPFFYQIMDAFRGALPDMVMVDVTLPVKLMRMRKSKEELSFQRKAAIACDNVMMALRDQIRPGIEEREIMMISEEVTWKSDCSPVFLYLNSTPTAASETCVPSQLTSRRKIQMGDVINTELTTAYGMYCSQILRPFFVGEPTKDYEQVYAVLKRVYDRLCAATKAGTKLDDLHAISLEFRDHGYTTVDGVLHGFGVDIMPPAIGAGFSPPLPSVKVLEANTTIVIQPNPTNKEETMGMQLGDMGVITETGFDVVHSYPAEVTRLF